MPLAVSDEVRVVNRTSAAEFVSPPESLPSAAATSFKMGMHMSTPVTVKTFEVKSHGSPDEVRSPSKTRVEVVKLDGFTMGRFNFEPGWRWSECVKPVVKTDQCQVAHVGYAVRGVLAVRLTDGREKTIRAGDSYTIPPGHDAWVEGSEAFEGIEVMSAEVYAKPQS